MGAALVRSTLNGPNVIVPDEEDEGAKLFVDETGCIPAVSSPSGLSGGACVTTFFLRGARGLAFVFRFMAFLVT